MNPFEFVKKAMLLTLVFGLVSSQISRAAEMANGLTSVTTSEVKTLLEGSGITIDISSIELIGIVKKFDSVTSLNLGTAIDPGVSYGLESPGLLLNSEWHVSPPAANASDHAEIKDFLESVLSDAGDSATLRSVSGLKFNLTSTSPSLALDFLFASSEEFDSAWDIAVVSVNGINYAKLPGDRILRVTSLSNLTDFTSAIGTTLDAIGVSAAAPTQTLVAPLVIGSENNILIAVGNTDDLLYGSFLLVSGLSGSSSTEVGIVSFGADESSPILAESQGSAFRFDARPTLTFGDGSSSNSSMCKLGQISYSDDVGISKFRVFNGTVNPADNSKIQVTYEFWNGEESLFKTFSTETEAIYVFSSTKKPTRCSTSVSLGLDTFVSWSN